MANYLQLVQSSQIHLSIGQLTETVTRVTGLRCTPAMIHNYERLGLISPVRRTEGGFRLFDIDTVNRVIQIKRWQEENRSLAEIAELFENGLPGENGTLEATDLPVDRRAKLLEAALLVFPRKGFAATTLQDIANEAEISTAAIYKYFGNKEELFLSLIDNLSFIEVLEDINTALNQGKNVALEDVRQALIEVADAFLDTHHPNAEIVRLFISEAQSFPEVGKHYCRRLIGPVEKLLELYLQNQIEQGLFREVDIKLAVHAFYGMFLNFIITQDLLCGEGVLYFPKRQRVQKMVDLYLFGIANQNSA